MDKTRFRTTVTRVVVLCVFAVVGFVWRLTTTYPTDPPAWQSVTLVALLLLLLMVFLFLMRQPRQGWRLLTVALLVALSVTQVAVPSHRMPVDWAASGAAFVAAVAWAVVWWSRRRTNRMNARMDRVMAEYYARAVTRGDWPC